MATNYWLGAAIAVPEVYTLSITGTWATADTCYVEINNKRLTLTVGTDSAIDNVGADLADMINGAAANNDESRSALGSDVGEFAELTAAYDSSNDDLTITGTDDGRPTGTVTAGATTAGDGAIAVDNSGDPTTAGTGPNHWSDTDNWSETAVPVNTDDVVFDHQGAASCLYGLSNTSLSLTSLTLTKGFKYSLGLPEINTDTANLPYDEHQATYLALSAGTTVDIDGSGGGIVKIDCGSSDTTVTVRGAGSPTEDNVPPVLLKINHASADLQVIDGDVGVCFESGTAGQLDTFTVGGTGQPSLTLGDTMTLSSCDGRITAGSVVCKAAMANVYVDGGQWEQRSGAVTALSISGGTCNDLSTGTFTTVNMTGGKYDHSRGLAKTITNFNVYARCTIADPQGTLTVTNGFDIYPPLRDVTLEFPTRKTYSLSDI